MITKMLETDYLIIGSGAAGMAFADVMMTETDATLILIDKYDKPGGHWNEAYSFVRLHQPARTYGVNSKPLGTDFIDEVGVNKGYNNLASGAEILAYYDEIMNKQFLPSGRVQYFPMCEYLDNHRFKSLITGEIFHVHVKNKTVHTTYMNCDVPSTHTRDFIVKAGVTCIPPNALKYINQPSSGFIIIGGGKTAIDTCVWLLEKGVRPTDIQWIIPRDPWLTNRERFQTSKEFFYKSMVFFKNLYTKANEANNYNEYLEKLCASGDLFRIDENIKPKVYRGPIVSYAELALIKKIRNIIRLGHVQRIEKDMIILDQGSVPSDPNKIYIDCTAQGTKRRPVVPVFDGPQIIPQPLGIFEYPFSIALTAHVEAIYSDEVEKNRLCQVVPVPKTDLDFLRGLIATTENIALWSQHKELDKWILKSRLRVTSVIASHIKFFDFKKKQFLKQISKEVSEALPKLKLFLKQEEEAERMTKETREAESLKSRMSA